MVSLVCVALIIGLFLFIKFTKTGQSMLAVAQDKEIAISLGIDTERTSSLCMAIGCALAAAAGSLMGPLLTVHPYMGMSPLLTSFIIVVLGGLGSILGTVIAALILGFADSFVTYFYDAPMASILGLTALLNMSAQVFSALKIAGSLYLLYLAWNMWREAGTLEIA